MFFFFSSRRRHTRSVSAFLLNRSSDLLPTVNTTGYIDHAAFIGIRVNRAKKSGMVNITSSVNSRERSGINTIRHELNRSEERRVGKECRSRGWTYHLKKENKKNKL